ncbi:hypothetical protein OsJ_01874 [Oryza sativa Japonica Group]|uniref:Uncharacterized protein n=1 Tax=Oryza sativa subsp. japonica TaxID=39947 RepID=B9EWW9_ORYSJ|nr:hypothetical protein OsJ_01874 [Oryza sativa Japonica Group]
MGCGDLIPPPVVPLQIAANGSVAYMGAIMAPLQEQDKQLVVHLAPTEADQLARMCSAGEPLWVRQRGAEVMAVEEHARMFRCEILLTSMNYQGTAIKYLIIAHTNKPSRRSGNGKDLVDTIESQNHEATDHQKDAKD